MVGMGLGEGRSRRCQGFLSAHVDDLPGGRADHPVHGQTVAGLEATDLQILITIHDEDPIELSAESFLHQ